MAGDNPAKTIKVEGYNLITYLSMLVSLAVQQTFKVEETSSGQQKAGDNPAKTGDVLFE